MPALSWSTCGRIGTTVRPAGRGAELQAALRARRGPGLRAGEAGVIPMRMESVEAMEALMDSGTGGKAMQEAPELSAFLRSVLL